MAQWGLNASFVGLSVSMNERKKTKGTRKDRKYNDASGKGQSIVLIHVLDIVVVIVVVVVVLL